MPLRARIRTVPGAVLHWLGSFVSPDACLRCGATAARFPLCPDCRREALATDPPSPEPPPGLARLHAGLRLTEPSRHLVHGLKYQGQRGNAKALVELAHERLAPLELPAGTVLVPVPVHSLRRRERGYNQALLLARAWSPRLGFPVLDALRRTRSTGTQTRLTAQERRRNLESALQVHPRTPVAGRTCLLIDDVATTGSTLSACAAALLRAGAVEVHGLACAWAPER